MPRVRGFLEASIQNFICWWSAEKNFFKMAAVRHDWLDTDSLGTYSKF